MNLSQHLTHSHTFFSLQGLFSRLLLLQIVEIDFFLFYFVFDQDLSKFYVVFNFVFSLILWNFIFGDFPKHVVWDWMGRSQLPSTNSSELNFVIVSWLKIPAVASSSRSPTLGKQFRKKYLLNLEFETSVKKSVCQAGSGPPGESGPNLGWSCTKTI